MIFFNEPERNCCSMTKTIICFMSLEVNLDFDFFELKYADIKYLNSSK